MSAYGGEIEVWKGDDLTFNFTIKDADGNAQDITGWTAQAILTSDVDESQITTTSWTITNASTGRGKLTLPAATSATLVEGGYRCRALRTNSGSRSTFSDWRMTVRTN